MTPQEHKLMLLIFTRQAMVIKALTDALVAGEFLQADDVPAFGTHLDEAERSYLSVGLKTTDLYKGCAKALGLETGL